MDSSQELSPSPSTSSKGFKGALVKARNNLKNDTAVRSSSQGDYDGERGGVRNSVDSLIDRARNSRVSSVDDGLPSGPSNLSKLVPGRTKKKQKRLDEAKQALKEAEGDRGRSADDQTATAAIPQQATENRSRSTLGEGEGSLSINDSDPESPEDSRPFLATHNSHIGYLTSTSPLIKTTNTEGLPEEQTGDSLDFQNPQYQKSNTLPPSTNDSTASLNLTPQHAATFSTRRGSSPGGSRSRGVSPGARIKDVLTLGSRKKDGSPPKSPGKNPQASLSNLSLGDQVRRKFKPKSVDMGQASEASDGVPSISVLDANASEKHLPKVDTHPSTPTSAGLQAPETLVTPPTPEDQRRNLPDSPTKQSRPSSASAVGSNIVVSPSGNMISHRRIRSDTGSTIPSKLSQAMPPPMTPMPEESRTPGGTARTTSQSSASIGFFSSVFSAAQNMTSTLTNTIGNPTRSRSSTETNEEGNAPFLPEQMSSVPKENDEKVKHEVKPLAIHTLGSGDLSLSHLGFGTESPANANAPNGAAFNGENEHPDILVQQDEAASRVDDASAARAVSAAYTEKSLGETPVAEDVSSIRRVKPAYAASIETGEKTPPTGSIFEGNDSIRRSGSVRSRVGSRVRKHRNSSSATGNTISTAALAGAALGNSAGAKPGGFTVASKKRNREFHQSFRSVPEDDYLIEDYSCALQREIILAGRIYISEGHICFFSNILGWVTTLVISFSEVVSMEKEYTAVVFPNAIAIQTLHARHTFRSLLSREATYELLIGIWKLSHPNLKSSVNGARLDSGTGDKTEKVDPSGSDEVSEATDELEDLDEEDQEEEEEEGTGSLTENGGGSLAGSLGDDKAATRKASAMGIAAGAAAVPGPTASEPKAAAGAAAASAASTDFPGPATHAVTECPDQASHYDKALADEIIQAPLGKVYSMTFGAASGGFMSKWLVDDMKCTDLQFEHDGKGLTDETKSRSMSYIKPLYAPIGPKSTKCLVTESLDFMDLEKAVSVTASTQTPDVPSGNVFVTKTHFCFMWAPGNATRVIMNYTIEWTGKSWLKGPIEKGATDGQTTYCNDLVKGLRAGVSAKAQRTTTGLTKKTKGGKKRLRSASSTSKTATIGPSTASKPILQSSWGPLEPIRPILSPVTDILAPLITSNVVIAFLLIIMLFNYLRSPKQSQLGYPSTLQRSADRVAAFEELWRREESDLWDWLDARVGGVQGNFNEREQGRRAGRQKPLKDKKMGDREMQEAIRVTEEKLSLLKRSMDDGGGEAVSEKGGIMIQSKLGFRGLVGTVWDKAYSCLAF
ncbi:uncharacterized protein KY384_000491 [Bacidia gigantensis]|uniref:uncharacterized protein n=1 Tax=Bacidia gigantensis TaxID=2732470 RepID=UPI001D04264A|nr:uncharacterized protein KY384_000491 [Bacidia gigantensis]KAG8525731.1 hypothetical protein KY384_000491 [Bacidia gigantensis]